MKTYYMIKKKNGEYFGEEGRIFMFDVEVTPLFKSFQHAVKLVTYGDRVLKVEIQELHTFDEGFENEDL